MQATCVGLAINKANYLEYLSHIFAELEDMLVLYKEHHNLKPGDNVIILLQQNELIQVNIRRLDW